VGYIEGEPKTKKGRRKILLPSVVVEVLREHKTRQGQARIKMGDRWKEYGLVFCNMYGSFFNPDHVWYLFKKLLKVAGLPNVRFHDLRHSAATVLLAAGVPLKVVSELLGHSLVAITADIYTHVLPEMQQEAVRRMDDLYGGS
jgi:integrase